VKSDVFEQDGNPFKSKIHPYLDACLKCNICAEHCSIYQTTKTHEPLSKLAILRKLVNEDDLSKDEQRELFTCTKCEGCQNSCPANLPLIALFDWGRDQIVSKYGFVNPMQNAVIDNIVQTGNPFHEEGARFKNIINQSESHSSQIHEYLRRDSKAMLHLGCMLDYRINQMATDLFDIFTILKIDFKLDANESCCGYYIWNCGDHQAANKFIANNLATFDQYDEVICACAGCYTFFRSNYPANLNFTHVIEKIATCLPEFLTQHPSATSKLLVENAKKAKVLFHDSCHLARPWGIITPPRAILQSLGHEIIEFEQTQDNTMCCGADGGMRFINKPLALQVGKTRLKEAQEKGSSLSTLCPFCIFNFREANPVPQELSIESLYHEIQQDLTRIVQLEAELEEPKGQKNPSLNPQLNIQ
jgi:Fe-S oxidoreductase